MPHPVALDDVIRSIPSIVSLPDREGFRRKGTGASDKAATSGFGERTSPWMSRQSFSSARRTRHGFTTSSALILNHEVYSKHVSCVVPAALLVQTTSC